jgi:hypothetical protein
MISDYNPNIEWGKRTVEIVLMQWAYKATFTLDVGGNCTGFSVIESAVGNLYEQLLGDADFARVTLTNATGDTLLCEDEEEEEEDVWLQRMVVSAQIVAWTPPTPGQ